MSSLILVFTPFHNSLVEGSNRVLLTSGICTKVDDRDGTQRLGNNIVSIIGQGDGLPARGLREELA